MNDQRGVARFSVRARGLIPLLLLVLQAGCARDETSWAKPAGKSLPTCDQLEAHQDRTAPADRPIHYSAFHLKPGQSPSPPVRASSTPALGALPAGTGGACRSAPQLDFTPCQTVTDPDFDYDICVDGRCRSPGACGDATCNAPGPSFPLPPAENHRAFKRRGDEEPVVIDEVTGLHWQGCPAGRRGPRCEGNSKRFAWKEALAYCNDLVWGGNEDWHLPNRFELHSLVDYGRLDPATDPQAFPGTGQEFWTSTAFAVGKDISWTLHFDSGHISYETRSQSHQVRCVRPGSTWGAGRPKVGARFERDQAQVGQPVVRDSVTGHFWQGCLAGQQGAQCKAGKVNFLTWKQAFAYCDGLDWGGHQDWRLPDAKELASILDSRRRSPAIDVNAFPGTLTSYHWTANAFRLDPSTAWQVIFSTGHVNTFDKAIPCLVRCIRPGARR